MADKLRNVEKRHHLMMQHAVRKIRNDGDLRYFIRQLIELTGLEDAKPFLDTQAMTHAVGRHSVGADLRGVLMSYDLKLYAELLLEAAIEEEEPTHDTE
jgi:hypothetical protein